MSETLDLKNIIEIEKIRKILLHEPDLLSLFELIIIVANKRINEEKTIINMKLEKNIEPSLSDHESDDDD
tara:strand:- start:212 stop:421 length:210 start_codon:yes stop_codon:yes gene_type:complete